MIVSKKSEYIVSNKLILGRGIDSECMVDNVPDLATSLVSSKIYARLVVSLNFSKQRAQEQRDYQVVLWAVLHV